MELKLSYFDFNGGRGEAARLAMAVGGVSFEDHRIPVADLAAFVWTRNLRSGVLDHVPADIVDRVAPALVAHCDRVAAHPGVAAYYAAR